MTDGSDDGKFTITKVRPGTYTLHATANGVLGDFAQANITVEPGKTIDLGKLDWKPVRYGRQLWEIGYPDRAGDKFFKGDGAELLALGLEPPLRPALPQRRYLHHRQKRLPQGLVLRRSPARDESVLSSTPTPKTPPTSASAGSKPNRSPSTRRPTRPAPGASTAAARRRSGPSSSTADKPQHGPAALRVALAGVDGLRNGLPVSLNGQSIGAIGDGSNPDNARLISTNAIRYNTDKGLWQQRTLKFDAALLKPGENAMTFTVPAGDLHSGVVWDYLRLELDNNSPFVGSSSSRHPYTLSPIAVVITTSRRHY